MGNTFTVNQYGWQCILNRFQEAVKNKEYDKIDYNLWKKLYNNTSIDTVKITDFPTSNVIDVYIDYTTGGTELFTLFKDLGCINTNGLYHYLSDHWWECLPFRLIETIPVSAPKDVIDQICTDLSSSFRVNDNTLYITKEQAEQSCYLPENVAVYGIKDANICSTTGAINDKIDDLIIDVEELKNKINNYNNKENNTMKNFNFDFGPCTKDNVRMSMYGLAVKNAAGTYVSYNANTNEIVDVDILNFDGGKYLYKMPTAVKDINTGDVIIHMHKPMFVTAISGDRKTITAVDVYDGESKNILIPRSPFGFDFVTKVVNLFGGFLQDNSPNEANPFGNMWMLALMGDDAGKMDDLLPLMLMSQGGNFASNPMMMYFLMKDGGNNDMLPFLMMMGQNTSSTAPSVNDAALDAPAI